ncbi:hypothetical protein [Spirosoma arcticum]
MPQSDCRIQTYVAVSKSRFDNKTNQTTYDYDPRGNLLKTVMTTDERSTSGTKGGQTGNKTVTYTYDADGFLTASASQELYVTTTTNNIQKQEITTTTRYSYANGRLSGYVTTRIGAYGVTTHAIDSLVYDASGDLVSRTETNTTVVHDPSIAKEITANSTGPTRVWTYQKNQLVDYVETYGTSEGRPLTIQNGVVTKIGGSNYEIRYGYDNQQRVTKQEHFANGQLNEYYLQTWTNSRPSSAALPPLKGFPTVIPVPESIQTGVLASKKTFFRNSVSNAIYQYNESTSVVQANAQGFITGATITSTHYPPASSQDVVTTETYTYTGCQ